jgi:hypothetical protein
MPDVVCGEFSTLPLQVPQELGVRMLLAIFIELLPIFHKIVRGIARCP